MRLSNICCLILSFGFGCFSMIDFIWYNDGLSPMYFALMAMLFLLLTILDEVKHYHEQDNI